LRTKLNCSNPKDIIDFLRANSRVPTRYLPSGELANEEDQFPIFPQEFSTQEYNSRSETTDSFDAFHAARGWFEYAQIVVPPPPKDEPAAAPSPNEYDTRLYRLPQRPALVIFRMAPPRAQSYLAERLTKEGWFTQDTVWDPDSGSDTVWFSSSATPVRLKATISAQAEWDKAYLMWRNYGTQNVLLPDSTELLRIKELSAMANAAFPMGERPRPAREYSDEEIDVLFPNRGGSQTDDERRALARQIINARRADVHFQQNSQITNFQYFLATSEAEKSPALVEARRLLWDADLLRLGADRKASLRLAVQSMVRWREVCQQFPRYHNNDSIQEQMVEAENSIVSSLKPEFTAQVEELRAARLALKALAPVAPEVDAGDALQALAENEAALRMADATRNDLLANRVQDVTVALTGAVGGWVPTVAEAELPGSVRRGLIEGEFAWMKQYTTDAKTTPWIRSTVRDTVKQRLGLSKPPETTTTTAPEGKPKPTLQTLPN
jgi:hypothetical protein